MFGAVSVTHRVTEPELGDPGEGGLNGPGVASWGEEQGRNMRKERQVRIRLQSPHGKVR